ERDLLARRSCAPCTPLLPSSGAARLLLPTGEGPSSAALTKCAVMVSAPAFPSPAGRGCRRRVRDGSGDSRLFLSIRHCAADAKPSPAPCTPMHPSSGAARHLLPEGEGMPH